MSKAASSRSLKDPPETRAGSSDRPTASRDGEDGDGNAPDDAPPPAIHFIDPGKVKVTRLPGGTYRATIAGDRTLLRVEFSRAFPISNTARFVELRDGAGECAGMLRDPNELDSASAKHVAACLEQKYFVPQVLEIYEIREEWGKQFWSVRTDRGEVEFFVKDPRRNVRALPPSRLLITDIDNNRYEVPHIPALDVEGRLLLDKVV